MQYQSGHLFKILCEVYPAAMPDRTDELMQAIAHREGTASQLAHRFQMTVEELRAFVEKHKSELDALRSEEPDDLDEGDVSPEQLTHLWIANKFERLRRYEEVCDYLQKIIFKGGWDATTLREYRSYMNYAAQELGQLLNRGAGNAEETTVSYSIEGVDMEKLS